jgi:hypothetical protein
MYKVAPSFPMCPREKKDRKEKNMRHKMTSLPYLRTARLKMKPPQTTVGKEYEKAVYHESREMER